MRRTVAAGLLAALAGLACDGPPAPARGPAPQPVHPQPPPSPAAASPSAPLAASAPGVGGPDFAAVFAAVSPTVVGVAAGRKGADGRFAPSRSGTGFVWDAAGHIITNDHLVADAREVRVRTLSGQVLRTRFVAGDGLTDVAILAIEGKARPQPALRAPRPDLRPGEWVAAIGNPYGLAHSISVGVISGVGRRSLPGDKTRFAALIQTDISVNPGNSGGPLVDAAGRVVGINTAMVDNAQGLAFAIPIEQATLVAERLLRDGRFVRGFGGLVVRPVTGKVAAKAGLRRRRGARVARVVEGGPADAAGLRPGDVILRFGDVVLDDVSRLSWLIASTEPGQSVSVAVARGKARLDVTMTIGAAR